MARTDEQSAPRFYFALPRLLARLAGGSSAPTEQNWLETNAVGGAIHLILFLTGAQALLAGRVWWQQVALLLPLFVLFWAFWIIYFYVTTRLLKLLRVRMPPDRAQGLLIAIVTSGCACWLLQAGGLLRVVAMVWLCAVSANVIAAGVLALLPHRNAERLQ